MNKRYTETLKVLIKAIAKNDSATLNKVTNINTRFQVQDRLLNRTQLSNITEMLFGANNNKGTPDISILEVKELISTNTVEQLIAIIKITSNNLLPPLLWDATITFLGNTIISVVMYMQSGSPSPIHKIRSINEEIYWMHEDEIIYIESIHNNIEYICSSNFTITSSNSLLNIENILSSDFVRIHRCYIVNKTHVKRIHRCEAFMSNGAILPIPVRKYTEIKKLLTSE